jgi:ABC-type nitrate/sulfonate/bicarbonate transport system permease component
MRPVATWLLVLGRRWALALLLIVAWEIATRLAPALFFPPPSVIVADMARLWLSGPPSQLFLTPSVWKDILPSLERMLAGWAIAVLCGTSAGVIISHSRTIARLVNPMLQFARSTPGPALVPIFLLLLGTGTTMRIMLIAFGSVWPILLNTIEGVREVDAIQIETARAFSLPRRARLWHVVLPSALPRIFAGMRIAIGISLILMVVSELVAATNGIGNMIGAAQRTFLLPDLWSGIVLLGLIGYLLSTVFVALERRILGWHRGARQRDVQ